MGLFFSEEKPYLLCHENTEKPQRHIIKEKKLW